jgi:glutathione S-transferase
MMDGQSGRKPSDMPVDPAAPIEVTAYRWIPPFAHGFVRDLRVRWALEEIGLSYRERLIGGAFEEKPQDYLADQPFGGVPVYKEGGLTLFESGAILIHIGEKDERLLPRDAVGRGRAISWMIAAQNTIEPMVQMLVLLRVAAQGKDWKEAAQDAARPFAQKKLAQLSRLFGEREWLEGEFTIGDLMMIDVLRNARKSDLLAAHPNLTAYVERGTARPAFKQALKNQLAAFAANQPQPEGAAA